jgi:hypothetical protein
MVTRAPEITLFAREARSYRGPGSVEAGLAPTLYPVPCGQRGVLHRRSILTIRNLLAPMFA